MHVRLLIRTALAAFLLVAAFFLFATFGSVSSKTRAPWIGSDWKAQHGSPQTKHAGALTHQDPERAGRHGILYDKVPTVPLDPTKDSKVIVMGKITKENTDWVAENLPDWQAAIYTVDNTTAPLHTPMNKGREANPYLLYVITHYDQLPETMVFIHPHRKGYPQAWHTDWQDYDMVGALNHLNVDFIQRNGYANLRCNWEPGCPDGVMYLREPNNPDKDRWMDHHMEQTWHHFFGKSSRVPERIATPCCAQFAVSGAQVRKRPREEYIRYHQWLMETEYEDDFSGRLLEYLWHVIFGQEPVYCPSMSQCRNDVYGKG